MSVEFLTPPSVPAAETLPELAGAPPAGRPELLVARAATAKEWLAALGQLEAVGLALRQSARGPGDPLVAVWIARPQENPEPLSVTADLVLLGGGWGLLGEILSDLARSRGRSRMARLERLADLPGVYVPALHAVECSPDGAVFRVLPRQAAEAVKGLAGGAPFEESPGPGPPGHPRAEVQRLLGSDCSPEELAGEVGAEDRFHLRFFVGLPGDSGAGIVEWVKRFRHARLHRLRDERALPRISVSLACFVPRPWTPLQWWPMRTATVLRDEIARVGRGLARIRGVAVTHDLPKWALLDGCLSMGDRRAGWLLLAVHRFGWDQALIQSPVNPAFILHRPRPADEPLPWDHLDWGIDRAGLRDRYEALLAAVGETA